MKCEPDWFCRGLAFLALAETSDGLMRVAMLCAVGWNWTAALVNAVIDWRARP